MIRVNVSGAPRARRKGKGGGAAAAGGGEFNPAIIGVLLIALALGGLFYMQQKLSKESAQIAADIQKEDREAARLAGIKKTFEERQKQKAEYENRVKVIDDLRTAQKGPVQLLDMVSKTVNHSDDVWLNVVTDGGNTINVEGTALSANAVADLMTEMMHTGYFKSVEIKETFQDNQEKQMQAFNFVLICEKQKS